MRETEFTKTADGKNWMDTSVISDIPRKVTTFNPLHLTKCFGRIISSLPCFSETNLTQRTLDELSFKNVVALMSVYVNNRRAWLQGDEASSAMAHAAMRNAFASECLQVLNPDAELEEQWIFRDAIRAELNADKNKAVNELCSAFLRDVEALLSEHMNENFFVEHRIVLQAPKNALQLEEYFDWRVVQWTKDQQAQIDARHESI